MGLEQAPYAKPMADLADGRMSGPAPIRLANTGEPRLVAKSLVPYLGTTWGARRERTPRRRFPRIWANNAATYPDTPIRDRLGILPASRTAHHRTAQGRTLSAFSLHIAHAYKRPRPPIYLSFLRSHRASLSRPPPAPVRSSHVARRRTGGGRLSLLNSHPSELPAFLYWYM